MATQHTYVFPTPTNSPTPAEYPTIQFNPGISYLELLSDPSGQGLSPTRRPPLQMPIANSESPDYSHLYPTRLQIKGFQDPSSGLTICYNSP